MCRGIVIQTVVTPVHLGNQHCKETVAVSRFCVKHAAIVIHELQKLKNYMLMTCKNHVPSSFNNTLYSSFGFRVTLVLSKLFRVSLSSLVHQLTLPSEYLARIGSSPDVVNVEKCADKSLFA